MSLLRLITLLCIALGLVGCLTLDNEIYGDEPPEVVDKTFVIVAAPEGVTLDGELYPYGTALEISAQNREQISAVGWGWNTVSFPKARLDSGEFRYGKVAWDRANNRLSFLDPPETSWLVRYFHWTQTFLSRAWAFILTFVLLAVCVFVGTLDAGDLDSRLEILFSTISTLFILLFIGSCQGNNYYGLYDWGSSQAKLATASDHIYPVSSGALNATHTISYDLGLLLWIPAFLFLHLIIAVLLPLSVRGAAQIYYRIFRKRLLVVDRKIREQRDIEVLLPASVGEVVNLHASTWKLRLIRRLLGISEDDERARQVEVERKVTEGINARVEYLRAIGQAKLIETILEIDKEELAAQLHGRQLRSLQLKNKITKEEERAKKGKSKRTLKKRLVDAGNDDEFVSELIVLLERAAVDKDEETRERVRKIKMLLLNER